MRLESVVRKDAAAPSIDVGIVIGFSSGILLSEKQSEGAYKGLLIKRNGVRKLLRVCPVAYRRLLATEDYHV